MNVERPVPRPVVLAGFALALTAIVLLRRALLRSRARRRSPAARTDPLADQRAERAHGPLDDRPAETPPAAPSLPWSVEVL